MANGIVTTANFAGAMSASIMSATVLSTLLGGWRNVLIFYGLPPVALSFLWLLSYRDPREAESHEIYPNTVSFHQALSHVIRIRGVWMIGVLQFGVFGAYNGVVGYLPLYLRGIGWSPPIADSAMMTLIGAMGACALPISLLSDRLGSRKKILFIVVLGLAVSLCLLPWVKGLGLWILLIVMGIMIGGMVPMSLAMIMELKGIGGTYVGTALGICASFSMAGAVMSPPLGNSLAHLHAGFPFIFWGAMAGIVTVALLLMRDSAVEGP
jgi:cyanate permease